MARVRNTFWKKQIDKLVQSENIPVIFKQYINFGTTGGETGYGFRDNAGTIQFKNSGGSWANFGGGGGTGTVDTVVAGTGIDVDATDPANPEVSLDSATQTSLGKADTALQAAAIGVTIQAYSAVLDAVTAAFTTAQETKLGYISVTQAVDLDQMETDIAALANGMVYKGDWDASAGSFPGSGSAQTGWFYYVTVAGTVDGVTFAIGDNIVATVDNASATTYASNWSKHDQTDAVQSVAGLIGSISKAGLLAALNVEDGADITDDVNVGAVNAAATSKATPIDADSFPIVDSAASNVIKRVTFTNLKAFLKTYIDSMTSTFTNKRITKRTGTVASSATPTINTDNVDYFSITALTTNITSMTTNLSGTPTPAQQIRIDITGTAARAITWGASFANGPVALPTTTVTTTTLYNLFEYNGSVWRCMASGSTV